MSPSATGQERWRYGMAPLIRFTLLGLYAALVLPLPLLAPSHLRPVLLWGALPLGLVLVLALTSERVILDAEGVRIGHPAWCGWWLRRGWQLPWEQVEGLTPVATSQGGRVFYVRRRGPAPTGDGRHNQAFLLPQRVERFEDFLDRFSRLSGLSTAGVGRISPPWTYQLLALFSGLMLAGEVLAIVRLT